MPTPKDTPWGRSSWAVRASISFGALYLAESVVVAVRVTLYCPSCRVMVGGAVLTPDYARKIGADFYSGDAKESVDIAKRIFG